MTRSLRLTMGAVLAPGATMAAVLLVLDAVRPNVDYVHGGFSRSDLAIALAVQALLVVGSSLWLRRTLRPIERMLDKYDKEYSALGEIVSRSELGILSFDANGKLLNANGSARRLLGLEGIGRDTRERSLLDSIDEDSRVRWLQALDVARRTGSSEQEVKLAGSGGEPAFVVFLIALRQPKPAYPAAYFSAIVRETTEHRRLEREHRAAKEEAERLYRENTMFLACISHDMRTPLNAIISTVRLIDRSGLTGDQQDGMAQIDLSSRQLQRLINNFLDYSRLGVDQVPLERIPFKPRNNLKHLMHTMNVLLGDKPVDLRLFVDPALPVVLTGDSHRLDQILYNLVGNAVKFTERGEVEVKLDVVAAGEEDARIRFAIRDTGIGMSEEQLCRLFRPFAQGSASVSRRYGGSGLGLAIAHALVRRMGGRLEAESEPGVGTEFRFELLFGTDAAPKALADNRAGFEGRVLIVEDHEITREIAAKMVNALGLEAEAVPDAEAALKLLEEDGRSFDLVLMDLHMPGLDGIQAASRIRGMPRHDRVPIVLTTADPMPEGETSWREAGIQAMLPKPLEPGALRELARRWLPASAAREPSDVSSSARPALNPVPRLEGLEVDLALSRMDRNEEMYSRLLTSFSRRYADAPLRLRALLDRGDGYEAQRLLHSLRGSAVHLGANDVYRAASRLEERVRASEIVSAEELKELGVRLATVIRSIRNYIKSVSKANNSDANPDTGGDGR